MGCVLRDGVDERPAVRRNINEAARFRRMFGNAVEHPVGAWTDDFLLARGGTGRQHTFAPEAGRCRVAIPLSELGFARPLRRINAAAGTAFDVRDPGALESWFGRRVGARRA